MIGSRTLSLVAFGIALVCPAPIGDAGTAQAQTVRQVFEKVKPSVAVIRARGRDVTTSGQTRFNETGSGVLVTPGHDGGARRPRHGRDRGRVPGR